MKFAADECRDAVLVAGLRDDGHDVWYAIESARGADDETILRQAAADDRILPTEDKNFGELVVRLALPAIGVVLLRMNPADSDTKLVRMRKVLQYHAARLTGSFVVVVESKTRVRCDDGRLLLKRYSQMAIIPACG